MLLMQVLLHAHQVASNKIDREAEARKRDEIRQLLEEKKNNTKKYEESLRTFAASDSSTEVEDDAFSLDDKGSASMIEVKSIGSTVDPDSLVECMGHVRSLLESMERLQQALANRSEGDDHSNHHQMAVDSYFVTRCHLDRVLLGSSNTTNPKDTEVAVRQPTSSKTYFVKKEKEKGSLIIEINATRPTRTETRKDILSPGRYGPQSRQRLLPKGEVGPGLPPGTQGTAYNSSRSFRECEPSDMRIHYSRSCPPEVIEKQSVSKPALAYSNINPASPASWLPPAHPPTMEPSTYGESHPRGVVYIPAMISNSQGMRPYQSSRDKIHGLDSETRRSKRREDTCCEKAIDTRKAAPEGNDEVDELLREWTTCFT